MKYCVCAAFLGGFLSFFPGQFAAGSVSPCPHLDPYGYCLEWEGSTPGAPGGGSGGGGGAGSDSDEFRCWWETFAISDAAAEASILHFGLAPIPDGIDYVWQRARCSDGQTGVVLRWVEVSAVTPAELATQARGQLANRLPPPVLAASPEIGTAAIVGVPAFVQVENWTDEARETVCAAGMCVTVVATPSVIFTPGEPGAPGPIACAGAGSRHQPGTDPYVAASEPGACAHVYQQRTGVEGRPATWPGRVDVEWTIGWSASSGESGSLPSVTRSSALPRSVSEVQTVVSGGATP